MSRPDVEKLTQTLGALLANVESLLQTGAGDADEVLHRAREHLGAAHEALQGRVKRLDRRVRANPWEAIAAASLVAFIIGLLVRRR